MKFIIKKDIKAAKNDNEHSLENSAFNGRSPAGIGVRILENGKIVAEKPKQTDSWYQVDETLFETNINEFQLGKKYPYNIQIKNSGSIDEYVRIIFFKRCRDMEGNIDKKTFLDKIEFNIFSENGWICDEVASTVEREVLYYENILPVGEKIDFLDYFRINGNVCDEYQMQKDEYGNIRINSNKVGYKFELEI